MSDLGLISYRAYWKDILLYYLCNYPEKEISVKAISEEMGEFTNLLAQNVYIFCRDSSVRHSVNVTVPGYDQVLAGEARHPEEGGRHCRLHGTC